MPFHDSSHYKKTIHMMIRNGNPKSNAKDNDSHETSLETCLHTHQPNYYSNLHVTLYFVKYNNSIPFFEEQSCQVNKLLMVCYN